MYTRKHPLEICNLKKYGMSENVMKSLKENYHINDVIVYKSTSKGSPTLMKLLLSSLLIFLRSNSEILFYFYFSSLYLLEKKNSLVTFYGINTFPMTQKFHTWIVTLDGNICQHHILLIYLFFFYVLR